ncbi:hypothetical protein [Bacillus pumilus]|uniref:hypothetical protein n=1 Tax=Bacillus pumilus TaxID=1408 RepID=UPI00227DABE0|nr:hypothetical protein [Bacillus pumilus]MCY7570966.1 hypothetical protein [Bacillus pumilus]MEC3763205.1 hypothetical protein [Bacillus pumilus]
MLKEQFRFKLSKKIIKEGNESLLDMIFTASKREDTDLYDITNNIDVESHVYQADCIVAFIKMGEWILIEELMLDRSELAAIKDNILHTEMHGHILNKIEKGILKKVEEAMYPSSRQIANN